MGPAAVLAAVMALAGGAAPAQEGLTVLSYNVCWQCMSPGRAGLGGKCTDVTVQGRTVTSCAKAMGAAIDSYAPRYDFVGLQEASHWQDFRLLAPKTLGKMTGIESRSGHEFMVSFYDPARFTQQYQTLNGDIGSGRPIMINLFSDAAGAAYTFVNIHNCHGGCTLSRLEQAIDEAVRQVDQEGGSLYAEITGFIGRSRIVVTGDFNEASYQQSGSGTVGWKPFFDAGIGTEAAVEDAPRSCCSTAIPWNCGPAGTLEPWCRPGDYVFDSKAAARPEIPAQYDASVPQSDHKPVLAVMD